MSLGGIQVTVHAIMRYRERVEAVSEDEAIVALSSPAIRLASSFGAPFVKLGSGHHVVLSHGSVVTVLPANTPPNYFIKHRGNA